MSETKKVTRTVTVYKTRNSTYQVDETAKQIRRVEGKNPALEAQGKDGEWQDYLSVLPYFGNTLYVQFASGRQIRTSTVQSTELVALTED
jgi:hypothetical protein